MHPTKSIIFIAVLGAALFAFGCSEEPGPSSSVSTPTGLQPSIGDEGAASDLNLPVTVDVGSSTIPRPPDLGELFKIDDECCEEVGQAAECWFEDAEADGVSCTEDDDSNCASGEHCVVISPSGDGVCSCDPDAVESPTDPQCNQGVCTEEGVCGPSWCNGYLICSCWGGCMPANEDVDPSTLCDDLADLGCCEGTYPSVPEDTDSDGDDESGSGYCSDDPACLGGCTTNADCEDGNSCTDNVCIVATGDCEFPDVDCTGATDQCNIGVCQPDGLGYDCVPQPILDNTPCNADGTGCTHNDTCQDGVCEEGPLISCNDLNVCTGPDTCIDDSSDTTLLQNSYLCSNPARPAGNAELYGYVDLDSCSDRFCSGLPVEGILGPPVAVNCDAADDVCNNWECNPAGIEDNCTNSMLIGTVCNADTNMCTTPDTCQDGGSGTAVCTPGPAVVCTPPSTVCLASTCNPTSGACDISVVDGIDCDDDANACTDGTCGGGFCLETPVDCSSFSNACNNGVCQEDGLGGYDCVLDPLADTVACNADDDGCTEDDHCDGSGTCVPGTPYVCASPNPCQSVACHSTGDYSHDCVTTDLPATTLCDADGSGCTEDDHCNGSGGCVAGTPVTAGDCIAALPSLDTECNSAYCHSLGATSYECLPDPLTLPAGTYCNNDNNGCTLDYCQDTGPTPGAECNTGPARDCTSLNIPPCQTGVCVASSFYASSCQPSYALASTLCDFDTNGCTENDHCNGAGACVAGTAVTCTPPDVCTTSECDSLSATTYECDDTAIPNCCNFDSECTSLCPAGYSPQCATPVCVAHSCACNLVAAGTECTDFDTASYPINCYTGFCGTVNDVSVWYPTFGANNGLCQPVEHPAFNNLCSDLFVQPAGTAIDTSHDGYLGYFDNDGSIVAGPLADVSGDLLTTTGSTRCANNNYQADGDDCNEWTTTDDSPIGTDGLDLAYVFEYETNASDQFDLYSYLIKVEGNFDLGVYIMTEVVEAADCPEGNNPTWDDPAYHWSALASRCNYPNSAASTVVEDLCDDTGNDDTSPRQTCCDPCADSSCYTSGYWWCSRGYKNDGSACNMCTPGSCDGIWEYPEDPFNCDGETAYDPAYMASTVIYPDGDTDGSTRRVFVFIDGVDAAVGDFQISIERRQWYASPCDRVNDDPRVFDFTHPGAAGATFLGTLENVVNSMHAGGGGACGGYACSDTWGGKTSCHDPSGSANKFWPNTEQFKVYRQVGEGSSTYCIMSDESIAGAADLVINGWRRYYSTATTICDESYTGVGCKHDNMGSNVRFSFTAAEDQLYLIMASQYTALNRPCLESLGDECHYSLTVYEGACPVDCDVPMEPPAGTSIEITPANYATYTLETRTGNLVNADGDHYTISGSDQEDEVYVVNNTSGNTVTLFVEMCGTSGVGDPMLALYSCNPDFPLVSADAHGGGGACEQFQYDLPPSTDPYYLTVQAYGSTEISNYSLTVEWGYSCGDGVREVDEVCDGADLNGYDCTDFGYAGGTLACNSTCDDFVLSSCIVENYAISYPTYSWIDISATGTAVTLSDDQASAAIAFGWSFPYYSTNYAQFSIVSNGFVIVGGCVVTGNCNERANVGIPDMSNPDNIVAAYWDNLDPAAGGSIRRQSFATCPVGTGACMVVEFVSVRHRGETNTAGVFETIFYQGGDIRMQYQSTGSESGSGATVGIENLDGTRGTQFSRDTASLSANLALCFHSPFTSGC